MRCDEIQLLLDLHIDSELPTELEIKLERHFLRCAICAGEALALEQTRRMLRESVDKAAPTPAFRERTAALLLDRFSKHLQPARSEEASRQWTLPFSQSERAG